MPQTESTGRAAAAPEAAHEADTEACIEACVRAHALALETVEHCLSRGGAHAEPAHVRILLDCADVSEASADFMHRGSDWSNALCGVCADVCEACAADCEAIDPDDKQMQKCAEACRRAAETCREMAAA